MIVTRSPGDPEYRRLWPQAVLAVMAALMCAATVAQEPAPDEAAEPPAPGELTVPEQTVALEGAADEQIAQRLTEILEATARYQAIDVRVENGIVFLRGEAERPDHREWARQLALRLEGVVAVVNDMEVRGATWDFTPAVQRMNEFWRNLVQSSPMVLLALAIVIIGLIAARFGSLVSERLLSRRTSSQLLSNILAKLVGVIIVIIGIYLALRVTGLTRLAVTMLGGTGLVGLIIGFGFRDIAENFLASLLISTQKPFRIGDTIEVVGQLGVVQRVTTRGTVLMAFNGNHIQLANSTVYKNTIINYTANPNVRLDFFVGVGYDAVITQVQEIIMCVLENHPAVLPDPEPWVLVEEFGPSTVNLHVYCWTNAQEYSIFKVKSAVMRLTLQALEEAEVPMPDEAREIVFPEGIPGQTTERTPREPVTAKKKAAQAGSHATATRSEGDLVSEVGELNEQARKARTPEQGRDILAE